MKRPFIELYEFLLHPIQPVVEDGFRYGFWSNSNFTSKLDIQKGQIDLCSVVSYERLWLGLNEFTKEPRWLYWWLVYKAFSKRVREAMEALGVMLGLEQLYIVDNGTVPKDNVEQFNKSCDDSSTPKLCPASFD